MGVKQQHSKPQTASTVKYKTTATMSQKPFLRVSRWNMGQNKTSGRVNQTSDTWFLSYYGAFCYISDVRFFFFEFTTDYVFRILICKVEGTSTTQSLQSNIATPFIKSNRHCITIIAHLVCFWCHYKVVPTVLCNVCLLTCFCALTHKLSCSVLLNGLTMVMTTTEDFTPLLDLETECSQFKCDIIPSSKI